IIQYSNSTDQAIAEIMADRLNCPTINCLRPYAFYGQYKTVIAVGEAKNKSGYTNVEIKGSNRKETLDKAIEYCEKLGK
ncbi:MAG: N-acetylmuramoyl-L-alanine amidase, partial [Clostridium sp.]|nr:N-acetylmuramoyl-L-alanine amidase [Clostridium sp.]